MANSTTPAAAVATIETKIHAELLATTPIAKATIPITINASATTIDVAVTGCAGPSQIGGRRPPAAAATPDPRLDSALAEEPSGHPGAAVVGGPLDRLTVLVEQHHAVASAPAVVEVAPGQRRPRLHRLRDGGAGTVGHRPPGRRLGLAVASVGH